MQPSQAINFCVFQVLIGFVVLGLDVTIGRKWLPQPLQQLSPHFGRVRVMLGLGAGILILVGIAGIALSPRVWFLDGW